MHGTIKWFDAVQGCGEITPYDASRDIFFRGIYRLRPDDSAPRVGMRVSYDENSETDANGRSVASDLRVIK
jgi:cold shock CspA family protein